MQQFEKAERILSKVLAEAPDHVLALCTRGEVRSRGLQDAEGAEADFTAALALKRDPATVAAAAQNAFFAGRMDEATELAREAIELDARPTLPYTILAKAQGSKVDDETLSNLEKAIEAPETTQSQRYVGLNALGRIYEKRRDYDTAFKFFTRSNQYAGGSYSAEERALTVADVRRTIDASFFEERRGFGVKDGRPVFVVGAPRSGSTLLEQVLTAHPKIDSVGEFNGLSQVERFVAERRGDDQLRFWRHDFLSSLSKAEASLGANYYLKEASALCINNNARRIIDKALINFIRIPLILLMFPNSRIIHTFRHPMDTCISCYKQDFKAAFYASDQSLLAQFFVSYYDYMEHIQDVLPDRIIHVCHEDFVTGFEDKAPAVVDAVGLEWNDACLRPEDNKRLVHTQSANSVRSAVNTGSFGGWKNYETHLDPLIEGLGGLDAIEARYEKFRALSV